MFNATTLLADAFGRHLAETYLRIYGGAFPEYARILDSAGKLIMERIANSDALYHNANHTSLVTLVGEAILRGKLTSRPVEPSDWLHFILALLAHDIGYVRGVCPGDGPDRFVINEAGDTITLPRGASDAALSAYHVDRSKIAVRSRFATMPAVDAERLADAIEYTRFRYRRTTPTAPPIPSRDWCARPISSGSSPIRYTCGGSTRSTTSSRRPASPGAAATRARQTWLTSIRPFSGRRWSRSSGRHCSISSSPSRESSGSPISTAMSSPSSTAGVVWGRIRPRGTSGARPQKCHKSWRVENRQRLS
jgi:hypothetical protein